MSREFTNKIHYIDTQEGTDKLAKLLSKDSKAYFDIEVDNMYHYFNEVSLFQFLVKKECYVLDVLSGVDVAPVLEALQDKCLIMHGADFDLRTLQQHYNFAPAEIFDTMIAARLIGELEFGLGALVKKFFGEALDKQFQRANWSNRPLDPELIEYAAKDTYLLPELYKVLKKQLKEKGRLHWHKEFCDLLIAQAQIKKEVEPDKVWRIKGSSKMLPRQLQALKTIWSWRDDTAQNKNKPPYKIMNNEAILDLCNNIPGEPKQAIKWNKLHYKTHASFRNSLSKALKIGMDEDISNWPQRLKNKNFPSKPKDPKLLEAIKQVRDDLAKELELPESLLINRESLNAIVETGVRDKESMRKAAKLMKWQEELLFDKWLDKAAEIRANA